jgi:hypothetical protein
MIKKISRDENLILIDYFFVLFKTLSEIDKVIEKYEISELHDAMAKMYNAMSAFSEKMEELSSGNDRKKSIN